MAGYTIRIKASVEKDIAALPRDLTVRILQGIEDLSEAPLPFGVRRLSGAENLYRIRGGLSDHICRAPRGAGDHHPLRPPPSHCMPWIVRSNCRLTEKDPRLRCPAGEKIHRSRPSPGRDVPGQPAIDWRAPSTLYSNPTTGISGVGSVEDSGVVMMVIGSPFSTSSK